MFGVVVDPPEQNAAMVEKLGLPFPILSDPDRSAVIEPYGAADPKDQRNIGRPTIMAIGTDGSELFRMGSRDFADRPSEEELVDTLEALDLPPTSQPTPTVGPAVPGPKAMPREALVPYYRGARFAAVALGNRHPEAKEDADRYVAQMDRYVGALKDSE